MMWIYIYTTVMTVATIVAVRMYLDAERRAADAVKGYKRADYFPDPVFSRSPISGPQSNYPTVDSAKVREQEMDDLLREMGLPEPTCAYVYESNMGGEALVCGMGRWAHQEYVTGISLGHNYTREI